MIHVAMNHTGDDLLSPPYGIRNYSPSGELSDLTMYTNLRHANGQWTYDTHNLYGMRKLTCVPSSSQPNVQQ